MAKAKLKAVPEPLNLTFDQILDKIQDLKTLPEDTRHEIVTTIRGMENSLAGLLLGGDPQKLGLINYPDWFQRGENFITEIVQRYYL